MPVKTDSKIGYYNRLITPRYGSVYKRRGEFGFGYEIIQVDENDKPQTMLYRSSSEDQLDKVLLKLVGGASVVDMPESLHEYSPKLLIFHEKHEERHFLIKNADDLYNIAFDVMRERYREGWYNHFLQKPVQPSYTVENILNLPKELQAHATSTLSKYNADLATYKQNLKVWNLVENAIIDKNKTYALSFLKARKKIRIRIL